MRRILLSVGLVCTGCSTAPIADVMDWALPGGAHSGPSKGGVKPIREPDGDGKIPPIPLGDPQPPNDRPPPIKLQSNDLPPPPAPPPNG